MKRRTALVAGMAALALTLGGCAATGDGAAPADSTLTVGFNTPPASLDPLRAANGQGRWYMDPAYMSVLQVDNDGNVIAGLSEEWGYVGDDNKTFRFTLRDGLEFSDGEALTAQAVVDSFEYFVENGSGPTRAYFLGMTATAVSDLEVEITTETPNPIIDIMLTQDYFAFSPISSAGLADDNARAGQTFGVGPYVLDLDATIPDSVYTYTKNEDYFDEDAAAYETIEVRVIPDAAQLVQALNTGQVEVIQVDANVADTVSDSATVMSRLAAWSGLVITDREGVNVPALADERVRQALAFALDRPALAEVALGEYGEAGVQAALEGDPTWGFDPELEGFYELDLDKAKDLLAEAGYADGFTFTLLYQSANPTEANLVQAIAAQLQEIGVTMELKAVPDFGAWVNDFVSGQYSATIFGGVGLPQYLNAQFFWTPQAIMNPYQVSDPDLNAAFDTLASASADDAAEAARGVTRVVAEKALTIPVYNQENIFAHASTVDGFTWLGDSGLPNSILSWKPSS
jgi:peptide/nickel transport system substrate-binding protein